MNGSKHKEPIPTDYQVKPETYTPFDRAALVGLLAAKKPIQPDWIGDNKKRQKRIAELNTDLAQEYLYRR